MSEATMWRNTTHDWASTLDLDHLAKIRDKPSLYAPGGVPHLIVEVIVYPADETLHARRPLQRQAARRWIRVDR